MRLAYINAYRNLTSACSLPADSFGVYQSSDILKCVLAIREMNEAHLTFPFIF